MIGPTTTREFTMKKFTFTVDIVGDGADVASIVSAIQSAVKSHGTYNCVDHADTIDLTDQGLKVWAKRKIGLSLASKAPKPKKEKSAVEATAS